MTTEINQQERQALKTMLRLRMAVKRDIQPEDLDMATREVLVEMNRRLTKKVVRTEIKHIVEELKSERT